MQYAAKVRKDLTHGTGKGRTDATVTFIRSAKRMRNGVVNRPTPNGGGNGVRTGRITSTSGQYSRGMRPGSAYAEAWLAQEAAGKRQLDWILKGER